MTDRRGQVDLKFQLDLAVGILIAAVIFAAIVAFLNSESSAESASLLMMGGLVAVVAPTAAAVFYLRHRHPAVTSQFLWLYAFLTFAMLAAAAVISGF